MDNDRNTTLEPFAPSQHEAYIIYPASHPCQRLSHRISSLRIQTHALHLSRQHRRPSMWLPCTGRAVQHWPNWCLRCPNVVLLQHFQLGCCGTYKSAAVSCYGRDGVQGAGYGAGFAVGVLASAVRFGICGYLFINAAAKVEN